VSAGKPSFPESYDVVNSNGIKVYIFKGATSEPKGIKISLEVERGVFKRLCVAGLEFSSLSVYEYWKIRTNNSRMPS